MSRGAKLAWRLVGVLAAVALSAWVKIAFFPTVSWWAWLVFA